MPGSLLEGLLLSLYCVSGWIGHDVGLCPIPLLDPTIDLNDY
jgi:hypothetical protein